MTNKAPTVRWSAAGKCVHLVLPSGETIPMEAADITRLVGGLIESAYHVGVLREMTVPTLDGSQPVHVTTVTPTQILFSYSDDPKVEKMVLCFGMTNLVVRLEHASLRRFGEEMIRLSEHPSAHSLQ